MSLALTAGVSARHLSFVETGRAHPGREVLLKIGDALELTPEEWRVLLASGGYCADTSHPVGSDTSEVVFALRVGSCAARAAGSSFVTSSEGHNSEVVVP
jgi:hypothetical protein